MAFLKLLLAFAPWLAFMVIAQGSLWRLKAGLIAALALSVVMGAARLHRGLILWFGLAFFALAGLAVIVFENMWAVSHMGVLANAALAASTWITTLMRRPFTLDYAKEHVDPALWNDPGFMRSNILVSSVWGATFTVNALLAYGKMRHAVVPELAYELASYALLVATAAYTVHYQNRKRGQRAAAGHGG